MDIKNYIKNELKDWKTFELVTLFGVLALIFINAIIVKDSVFSIAAAFFGIMFTVLNGKGKITCFYFGLIGSSCYSFISLQHHLWGQCLLYMGWYVPMQALGLFRWKKNLKKDSKTDVVKTKLSIKEIIILSIIAIVASAAAVYFLANYTNDASPLFDGITPVLSIIGMYLTVKRCIEQWIIWVFVNGMTTAIWVEAILNGSLAYSAAIMWAFYFVLAFYFYFEWKKEVK